MRFFRALLVLIPLFFASTLFARADGVDFNMGVQDPPACTQFCGFSSSPFQFNFGACLDPGEADGCLYGQNITGGPWTSMTFLVPDTGYIADTQQTASCSTGGLFRTENCPPDPQNGYFVLTFSDGTIQNDQVFLITETGVPYADFPTVTVYFNGGPAATPEPNSLLLLATGVLALGWVGSRRLAGRLQ